MRISQIILFTVLAQFCWSQEFVFELIITDNKGNTDTVEIGYDRQGTDSLDINLGEENIADDQWEKPLDVRCTNVWEDGVFPKGDELHLKRWISELNCNDRKRLLHIKLDIFTDNWPVTIRWDSSRLQNECLNYSVISDRWVQNWFDVASANNIDLCMGGIGAGVFDRHESINNDHVRFDQQTGDTIFFVYVGLGNEWQTNSTTSPPTYCELRTQVKEQSDSRITIRNNCITFSDKTVEEVTYRLYSLDGQQIESGKITKEGKCLNWYRGIGILELSIDEQRVWKKMHSN